MDTSKTWMNPPGIIFSQKYVKWRIPDIKKYILYDFIYGNF